MYIQCVVKSILKEWLHEANVSDVAVRTRYNGAKCTLIIVTNKPGALIGRAGVLVDRYKEKLSSVSSIESIEIYEVDKFIHVTTKEK